MSDIAKRVIWSIALSIPSAAIGVILRGVFQAWGIFDPFSQWLGGWLKMHITAAQIEWTIAAAVAFLAYAGLLWIVWRYHRAPAPIIIGDQANFHGEVIGSPEEPDRIPLVKLREMAAEVGWNIDSHTSADPFVLEKKLNQAAVDGLVTFYGRKYDIAYPEECNPDTLVPIPISHFVDKYVFDCREVFGRDVKNYDIHTSKILKTMGAQKGEIYRDIHADKKQLEDWIAKNRKGR